MTTDDPDAYLALNRANWDDRAPAHASSPDYEVERFAADPAFLSGVVRFDVPRLGDLTGLTGVHLQCHLGTDTISLARLGARMTGLDLSPVSLEHARRIAAASGTDVRYVEADVYSALSVLPPGGFDLVFTGIGALCWLPDIRRWAQVVAALLRPGGRLFLREGHPMLWTIDETREDLVVHYPYFERPEPVVYDDGSTYVATDAVFTHNVSHSWNHGLGEVVTALFDAGLDLTQLVEHDSAPWQALPGKMVAGDDGEWRLAGKRWLLPLSYTLQATRRSPGADHRGAVA